MRNLYEILEVSQTASDDDIKKSYKKMAMKYHPDKHPGKTDEEKKETEEKFKEISFANEILSDSEKRKNYDTHGESSFNRGGEGGSAADTIFKHFFGGNFFNFGNNAGPKKCQAQQHNLEITLEELFCKKIVKKDITVKKICTDCKGVGSMTNVSSKCSVCSGKGMTTMIRQMGPIVQQIQTVCSRCTGLGVYIEEKDACKKCKGERVVDVKITLDFDLEKRPNLYDIFLYPGKTMIMQGIGNELPDYQTGDVAFTILPHPKNMYVLKDSIHLHTSTTITLLEALTGAVINLKKLDGKTLTITTNTIIEPDQVITIDNEGMPCGDKRGNLYISLHIQFPKKINLSDKKTLEKIFNNQVNF